MKRELKKANFQIAQSNIQKCIIDKRKGQENLISDLK